MALYLRQQVEKPVLTMVSVRMAVLDYILMRLTVVGVVLVMLMIIVQSPLKLQNDQIVVIGMSVILPLKNLSIFVLIFVT